MDVKRPQPGLNEKRDGGGRVRARLKWKSTCVCVWGVKKKKRKSMRMSHLDVLDWPYGWLVRKCQQRLNSIRNIKPN